MSRKTTIPKVFIGYLREDKKEAARLARALSRQGISVFFDERSLLPGSRWEKEIQSRIAEADFFVACFSPAFFKRENFFNTELRLAFNSLGSRQTADKWLIPVKLNSCDISKLTTEIGFDINNLQCVDLSHHWDIGIRKIVKSIDPFFFSDDPYNGFDIDQVQEDSPLSWLSSDYILNKPEIIKNCLNRRLGASALSSIESLSELRVSRLENARAIKHRLSRVPKQYYRGGGVGEGDRHDEECVSFVTVNNEVLYDIVPQDIDCYEDYPGESPYKKSGESIAHVLAQHQDIAYVVIHRWIFDAFELSRDSHGNYDYDEILNRHILDIYHVAGSLSGYKEELFG